MNMWLARGGWRGETKEKERGMICFDWQWLSGKAGVRRRDEEWQARKLLAHKRTSVCPSRERVVQRKSEESLISSRSTFTQNLVAVARESTRKGNSFDWPYTNIKAPYLLSPNYYDSSSAFRPLPDFACVKRKGPCEGKNLAIWGTELKLLLALFTRHGVPLFFPLSFSSMFSPFYFLLPKI
jgi:hypothetical protein